MTLYERIYETVKRRILSEELKPGDKLPHEVDMARDLGVSRPTVRSAVLKLVNEGYLTRTRHKGTFVTVPKLMNESTRFIAGYREELEKAGLEAKTRVLEFRLKKADDLVAKRLEIPAGEKVIFLKRLRTAPGSSIKKPLVLTCVYLSYKKFPFLLEYDFETESLYDVLERHGVRVTDVVRELEIGYPDQRNAQALECKTSDPVHFISSVGHDKDGNTVEFAQSYYPADRNKFHLYITR